MEKQCQGAAQHPFTAPPKGTNQCKFAGGEINCSNEITELDSHKYSINSLFCQMIQHNVPQNISSAFWQVCYHTNTLVATENVAAT